MKILFLSRWFPFPTDNGSKLRIYNLLRGLADRHEVHLLSFADEPADAEKKELQAICATVRVAPWREFRPSNLSALMGFFHPQPRSLIDTYSAEMENAIQQALLGEDFDLVILSQWQMAAYRHLVKDVPALFEEIEVGVLYEQYQKAAGLARMRAALTWHKHRRFLDRVLMGETCTVVSEKEQSLLLSLVSEADIHVIPNAVSVQSYEHVHEAPEPDTMIFTGSFRYRPNYEAMIWFAGFVLPLIQEQIPHVRLTITGDPAGLPFPAYQGVVQTGFVDNIYPLIARSWVSVVPLLVGGGTRLKILEAMALGTPVVSTSKGAEGLNAQPGKQLLIGNTAEQFARQTIVLLRDVDLRKRLAVDALRFVKEQYDWEAVLPIFLDVVESVGRKNFQEDEAFVR
ncbi:MAG TPA: glycosyltransferase [Chloroflexi bacterium]|nr:glycosyltransferase [Chloroflexota bacterium]